MGEEEEKEKKGFVVKDKRIFDDSGERRAAEEPVAKKSPEPASERSEYPPEPDQEEADYLPEVSFYNFIVSLSTTALYHFGDFAEPGTKAQKNLPAAQEIIDTLAMLKEKTAGNLDVNENDLIEDVLYELRMRYVKETT